MFTDKVMNETSFFKKKNLIIYSRFGRRIFCRFSEAGRDRNITGPLFKLRAQFAKDLRQ